MEKGLAKQIEHESDRVQKLLFMIECLKKENEQLKKRQNSIYQIPINIFQPDSNGKPHRNDQGNGCISGYMPDMNAAKAAVEISNYKCMLSVLSEGVALIDRNYIYQAMNKAYAMVCGKSPEDFIGVSAEAVFGRKNFWEKLKPYIDQCFEGKESREQSWYHFPDNKTKFLDYYRYPIFDEAENVVGAVVNFKDLTAMKQAEQRRKDREQQYQELVDSLQEVVFEMDVQGNLLFVNKKGYEFFGYSREDVAKGFNVFDSVVAEDKARCLESMKKLLTGTYQGSSEYRLLHKSGDILYVIIHTSPKFSQGKVVGCRGVIVDISARKKAEEQLRYFTCHDALTGLYNRTHFEQQMRRLEADGKQHIGLIICDMDGLKLINDTLGHRQGDILLQALAEVLKRSFRQEDMVARIGGDEFAVLLLHSSREGTEKAYQRILKNIVQYNAGHQDKQVNLSAGFVFAETSHNMLQLFKEADDNMYRQKLSHKQSVKRTIVKTLMKSLEGRDYFTEGHAKRIATMVVALGQLEGLPETKMGELKLFAQFHDVGKVGIPDYILFKPGPLTKEEMVQMKKHTEIGYRIANATPGLEKIATLILSHHEWWNGKGYPLALKGEEIPRECRILAIADAYDSMTSDRPYHKALSTSQAVAELLRGAGTQFDPALVQKFVTHVCAE